MIRYTALMKKILHKNALFFIFFILFLVGISFALTLLPTSKRPLSGKEPAVIPILPHTFILMGDTGSGNENQFLVADQIKKYCTQKQSCEAVFILGDIIYEEGVQSVDDLQFETKFEEPYQNIALPFYIGYGNHDYLGCRECYLEYQAHSEKWKMPARYYKQKFSDDISFFMTDTENFDTEQQQWLAEELQQAHKWKIVLGHRPVLSFENTKYGEEWNGKTELAALTCKDAQFYVSGHAHLMEDNKQLPNCTARLLVSGGGGAYIRESVTASESAFVAAKNGFTALTIIGNQANYEFVDKTGAVVYSGSVLR